ncbi:MAG: hypothetical protein HQL87_13590 [Magnetococcales bacterium]|nr:hypothetical protein [Magnetococcales bacterium]
MKQTGKFALCLLFLLVTSGCARTAQDYLYQDYRPADLTYGDQNNPQEKIVSELMASFATQKGCIDGSNNNDTDCKPVRRIIVGDLLGISGSFCEKHKSTILGNEANYNMTLGTVTNLFSGAATIIGGVETKTVFAGMAALSNAERSLINESVYRTMIASAVLAKIEADQGSGRAAIQNKLNNTMAEYPIAYAVQDVLDLHHRCSFQYGLSAALKNGTQDTTDAQINYAEAELGRLQAAQDNRANLLKNTNPTMPCIQDTSCRSMTTQITAINEQLTTLKLGKMGATQPLVNTQP